MAVPRWLLPMGIVLWVTAVVQATGAATAADPTGRSRFIDLMQSAANQDRATVTPDVTLSLRDINDEYVTSVVIGSAVQLVLTVKTDKSAQAPSNTMLLPWRCRAVSEHKDSPQERYILLDGCGDGDVISGDAGFLYSPWWEVSASTQTARSDFFPVFGLPTRGALSFECELVTVTDQLKDKSCVKSESRMMHARRRMKRALSPNLPHARTAPIKMLPHTPGTVVLDNPYLQTHYYAEDFNRPDTTRRTPPPTVFTTPTPPTTTTITTTTTARTTSTWRTSPPTATTTTITTTPKSKTKTIVLSPVDNTVIIQEPDMHAALSSQEFMLSVMNSPLVMGLLVGLGFLVFILLLVAIPTAFLCCRVLRTSMEKDPGGNPVGYPYLTYAPMSPVGYGQHPDMGQYQPVQNGQQFMYEPEQNGVLAQYQPAQNGLPNGVQVLPVQQNAQPAQGNAQPAQRNDQPTLRNAQPVQRNAHPTPRNPQPAPRNIEPAQAQMTNLI